MRISRKSEYALRALAAMARVPRSWQIAELSANENIPEKFLEQILLILRRGGLLSSKRGVGGGYTLRRLPNQITVREIIELLDGPTAPVPCAIDPSGKMCSCPDPRTCPVRLCLTTVREQLDQLLDAHTLEDLSRPPTPVVSYDI